MSKLLNKYLSQKDLEEIKELETAIQNDVLSITCMGLYNHGKSTLLNALIKDFNDTTFATADVRETSSNKTIQIGSIAYIDTPGLNANDNDDKRVMDAVKKSDLNLFVHTVTTGEFVHKEIEFLQSIKQHWSNPTQFIERTIFVISRIDKANNQEDIQNTIKKISEQIVDIFEVKPLIVDVSAHRYIKGKKENKQLMIKKSNILKLEQLIYDLSNQMKEQVKNTRIKRLEKCYDFLISQLKSKVEKNKLELSKQKKLYKTYLEDRQDAITRTEKTLKNMYSSLKGT